MKDRRPYTFISYQVKDKKIAGEIKEFLSSIDIDAFLAHEDINVSDEWRDRILHELDRSDLFICVLSKAYYESIWCIQESGIAAYRNIAIIPLTIDDSIPEGFIRHVQSSKIDGRSIYQIDIVKGLIKYDLAIGLTAAIQLIEWSRTYWAAETAFELLNPYIGQLTDSQMKKLLQASRQNSQIHGAQKCARDFLPPILESHGHLLDEGDLRFLKDRCKIYAEN